MVGASGPSRAAASAVSGIRQAMDRMDAAAGLVADAGGSGSDAVTLSGEAPAPSASDELKPLVDIRMARYAVAAQVSVLRTVDEVSEDVLGIVGRRSG